MTGSGSGGLRGAQGGVIREPVLPSQPNVPRGKLASGDRNQVDSGVLLTAMSELELVDRFAGQGQEEFLELLGE